MRIIEFNRLRKYESYLATALRGNFIRSMSIKQVEEIEDISMELGMGWKYNHCPNCLLNQMKRLAVEYFKQKEKNENNKKKKGDSNED